MGEGGEVVEERVVVFAQVCEGVRGGCSAKHLVVGMVEEIVLQGRVFELSRLEIAHESFEYKAVKCGERQ